jgi:hypothetical protein
MHCHMTHHVMNQMGHDFPNMLGADAAASMGASPPRRPWLHDDGQTGMGDMMKMGMPAGEQHLHEGGPTARSG